MSIFCDYFCDFIFFLDSYMCMYARKLDLFLINKFKFSIIVFNEEFEDFIRCSNIYFNKIKLVRLIKDIEFYVNNNHFVKFDRVITKDSYVVKLYQQFMITFLGMYFSFLLFYFVSSVFVKLKETLMSFYNIKLILEIDNNFSNYLDVKKIIIFSCMFFSFVLGFYIINKYILTSVMYMSVFFLLNFLTLLGYIYVYNLNVFVFFKGMYSSSNYFFNLFQDTLAMFTFISRLFLQFLRLILCFFIVFIVHETSLIIIEELVQYYVCVVKHNSYSYSYEKIIKNSIEYLDLFINFMSQYANYIAFTIWLIPYLFSYVTEDNKIDNK